jgi:hypothetical protein
MGDTNSKVFSAMESVAADKTFVDLFKIPEETTTETKEDVKTWKNFENVLGDDFPDDKRMVLKKLWVEGGRPNIEIMAGLAKKTEKSGSSTKTSWIPHRAHYSLSDDAKEGARDTLNVGLVDPVDSFLAELGHAFQFRRRPDEDFDAWEKRRTELWRRVKKDDRLFGDPGKYGTRELVASEIQTDPDVEVSMEMRKMFPVSLVDEFPELEWFPGGPRITSGSVIYDPETRLGTGGEKPTMEFEAHSIIEDSLWGDFQNRFGKKWGERGEGWRPYQKKWGKQAKKEVLNSIDELFEKGYLE